MIIVIKGKPGKPPLLLAASLLSAAPDPRAWRRRPDPHRCHPNCHNHHRNRHNHHRIHHDHHRNHHNHHMNRHNYLWINTHVLKVVVFW